MLASGAKSAWLAMQTSLDVRIGSVLNLPNLNVIFLLMNCERGSSVTGIMRYLMCAC